MILKIYFKKSYFIFIASISEGNGGGEENYKILGFITFIDEKISENVFKINTKSNFVQQKQCIEVNQDFTNSLNESYYIPIVYLYKLRMNWSILINNNLRHYFSIIITHILYK